MAEQQGRSLETASDIQQRRDQVLQRYDRFKQAAEQRRAKLQDALRLQQFRRDADELEGWIGEKLQTASDEAYKDTSNLQVRDLSADGDVFSAPLRRASRALVETVDVGSWPCAHGLWCGETSRPSAVWTFWSTFGNNFRVYRQTSCSPITSDTLSVELQRERAAFGFSLRFGALGSEWELHSPMWSRHCQTHCVYCAFLPEILDPRCRDVPLHERDTWIVAQIMNANCAVWLGKCGANFMQSREKSSSDHKSILPKHVIVHLHKFMPACN